MITYKTDNTKSRVSKDYLNLIHNIHDHKVQRLPLNVVLTGDKRPGSIGEAIREEIKYHSWSSSKLSSYSLDVREPVPFYYFQNTNTLILCHGVTHLDWFEDCPIDKAKEIIDVNLFGTVNLVSSFVRDTIDNDFRKRIIIIGSMAHKSVLNGSAVYCASKAALAHLARCLAWELAPKAYDVFIIHPSNTYKTPMTEETIQGLQRYRMMTREEAESYWNDSPIRKKILNTREIAKLVVFLLGPEAQYLSGCQLDLAGGQR